MSEGSHSMDLEAFAQLSRIRLPRVPQPKAGWPVVITPALDVLVDVADDMAVAGPLADALADLRALHDYRERRLGGRPR